MQQDRKSSWLGRLPGSCRESSFWAGDPCGSWDEMGAQEEHIHERIVSRKQPNEGLTEDLDGAVTEAIPVDTGLVLALLSLDQVVPKTPHAAWLFALLPAASVYRNAAAFVGRVPGSLYHMYKPCVALAPKNSAIPEITSSARKEHTQKKEKHPNPLAHFFLRQNVDC